MKKLLLGVMLAAACVSDADASAFQTKSSKNNVDTILKADMGNYYKGMVNLVNALLVGWADSLSYAAKDTDFKSEKTQLSNAGKKLKVIAKFTESILNRDREKSITSNQSKAVAAAKAFSDVINQLKVTEYWKHCGAQLRFSVIIITNSLQSLAQKNEQFSAAGARVSSSQGWIDGNGYSTSYNLADNNDLIKNDSVSGTSKVSNLLSEFKKISTSLTAFTPVQNVTTSVNNAAAQAKSVAATTTQVTTSAVTPVQNTVSQVTTSAVTPVQNTASQVKTSTSTTVQKTATRARR